MQVAIAQHFGRPGTPTDQAWIESFFGHLKIEHPYLLLIEEPAVLRDELTVRQQHYNTVAIGRFSNALRNRYRLWGRRLRQRPT